MFALHRGHEIVKNDNAKITSVHGLRTVASVGRLRVAGAQEAERTRQQVGILGSAGAQADERSRSAAAQKCGCCNCCTNTSTTRGSMNTVNSTP
ncbi:MAG: hypothetical protein C4338_02040 [Rhodanobacteraceae bacterium]